MGNNAACCGPPPPISAANKPSLLHDHIVKKAGDVHAIVCALDYKKTTCPLTCTVDGKNLMDLARQCGVSNLMSLFDEAATVKNVSKVVKQVGCQCKPGDTFVFFYAGHGTNVPCIRDRAEADGQDEAYCLVDERGGVGTSSLLRDDDFCELITTCVPKETKVLVMSDCCHSGTICDFGSPVWAGRQAISISGCKDEQTSGDTGKGGIFTHSVLMAVQALVAKKNHFSVGEVFTCAVEEDGKTFVSPQVITMEASPGTCVDCIAWPFIPPLSYQAPWVAGKSHWPPPRACSTSGGSAKPLWHIPPRDPPSTATKSHVHLLVCALDYKKTSNPLSCTEDAEHVMQLAKDCGIKDVVSIFNEAATTQGVTDAIRSIGRRCTPGDFLIFFYAGQGSQLPDQDGDEADGQDECFVLVNAAGEISVETCLRADDFARAVTASVPRGTNICLVADCCHSGTVADFSRSEWVGHKALSLSACTDRKKSDDTGMGGGLTHSMLLAVEKLSQDKSGNYSVGTLCRALQEKEESSFRSPQNVSIQAAPGTTFDSMPWPMIPPPAYRAPWSRRAAEKKAAPAMSKPRVVPPTESEPAPVLPPPPVEPSPPVPKARSKWGCFGSKKPKK